MFALLCAALATTGGTSYAAAPPSATITGPGKKCVDVDGDDSGGNGAAVQLWDCHAPARDQHWTHRSDGSLSTLGRCLDVDSSGTAAGTRVQLYDCNGTGGQVWRARADGSLFNPQSGRCLDSPDGNTANGTDLRLWDCNGSAAQRFTVTNGTIVGPGDKCVDVDGDDAGGNLKPVQLWDCLAEAADQHWTRNANGSLSTLGRCLDVDSSGTAAGTRVQLYDCNGTGAQAWQQRADGSLFNPQSGRCLDSPSGNTANGTRLQIWDCNGSAAQRFRVNAAGGTQTGGFVYPAPGQTTGPGQLPPATTRVDYLGRQDYGTEVARDLGFSGVVNGQSVWTYGDTLVPDGRGGWIITANDSVGLGVKDNPIRINQRVGSNGWPDQWIPYTDAESANGGAGRYGMGGTNVVEYAPNKGLVWFLRNNRGSGGQGIEGAGVATVTADANGARATRVSDDLMWAADEPWWGDVGVTYNSQDGKVYVYGHGAGEFSRNIYLARVPANRATEVAAYEYWDQSARTWSTQRLTLGGANGTKKLTDAQSIFPDHMLGQSNAFWSNHYNTWMFVAGADVGYSDIMVMTAPRLEGPWTKLTTVGSTCPTGTCGLRYAIAPHPEYDPTGKTLLVTWTDDNVIHSSRLTWR
ncbi:ricin-type beta-trefoil lectin domain protein [Streptomyces sp. NPDC056296]|uniref:ricin-type beta-trefoil lectin domain protein n=1 Tax=Streptomyces sp. NPDC056296 TaxID=3345775 RepID=UPI0035DBDFA1